MDRLIILFISMVLQVLQLQPMVVTWSLVGSWDSYLWRDRREENRIPALFNRDFPTCVQHGDLIHIVLLSLTRKKRLLK